MSYTNRKPETYPMVDQYEGQPILRLSSYFSFGLAKARAIVANYDAIKAFVESAKPKALETPKPSEPAPKSKSEPKSKPTPKVDDGTKRKLRPDEAAALKSHTDAFKAIVESSLADGYGFDAAMDYARSLVTV